jgi:tetratricopeptide (TPR) repeat protein
VVLAGDHGEAFGEHGENGHTFFGYEENIRVPLSISMSGSIPKGLKVQTPINLIDIVPTILDFVEIEMPGFVQGRSVLPLAAGRKMSSPPIYFETHFAQEALSCAPLSGILDGHFKYIRLPKPELYDLGTDRMEKKNLLPAEAARGRAMESALKNLEDESAKGGFGSVRVMSDDERRRLASLGYLSAKGRSRPSHLGIDPKDKIEFWNKTLLGKQLLETRKLPEAESLLHGLFRVDPGFGPVIEDLMELYFQAGRRDKIQEILKAGMAADPGNSALRIKGAIYLVRLNLPQKAVEILVDAEKNVEISDKAQFYYVLGNAYGKMAKYAEAEAVLEKALGVEPDNLEILRLLGHCRLQLGDYREALSFFRKAETGMAGDPRLLEDTAMALANLKDYAGAKPYFEKAVRANPSAQIYANYALVYAEEKDYPRAAALMETALRAKDLDETLKTACLAYLREWAPRLK